QVAPREEPRLTLEDDVAQLRPVFVVAVDHHRDLGVLADVPDALERVEWLRLGLGVEGGEERAAVPRIADGDDERLSRRVGRAEAPDAPIGDESGYGGRHAAHGGSAARPSEPRGSD